MHLPELCGFVQFSHVHPGAHPREPFVCVPGEWQARCLAMTVYYAQHEHRKRFHRFASSISDLKPLVEAIRWPTQDSRVLDSCASTITIQAHRDTSFTATIFLGQSFLEARVNQERYLEIFRRNQGASDGLGSASKDDLELIL